MSDSPFGLSGEDYWKQPWKNAEAMHEKHVLDRKYGLFIDAPPAVNPGLHSTLPMPFLYADEMREAYKVDLPTMAQVVASRTEDRALKIGPAIAPVDREEPAAKVGADSENPISEKHLIDLQGQLGLLNEPGTYHIAVLLRHKMSNVVATVVERKKVKYDDPEVEKFIESQRKPLLPAPPPAPSNQLVWAPGETGVRPSPYAGSPEPPEKPGITLTIERVVLNRQGAKAILKGAFRLAVHNSELAPIDPDEPAQRVALGLPFYGRPRPVAIIPINIVVTGSVNLSATVFRLQVPTYQPVDPKAAVMMTTGHFAIDLLAHPDLRTDPQTFAIYAFCGEILSGPHLMATVTEPMLPKPGE